MSQDQPASSQIGYDLTGRYVVGHGRMLIYLVVSLALWCLAASASAQQSLGAQQSVEAQLMSAEPQPQSRTVEVPPWVTAGPFTEQRDFNVELPLQVMANKLYVNVMMGGHPRRFVYDTGSPSMLDAQLAAELGLVVIDRTDGVDSHGHIITSDIVQADLSLGGVTFKKVPMFVADFASSEVTRCLIGDGVLGSELLPQCAWQIDLPDSTLRCASSISELEHVDSAKQLPLYDFGYPHIPMVDVRFARHARSKVMFDTGSPGYLAMSPADFAGTRKVAKIQQLTSGYGSLGRSLGGQAADAVQHKGRLRRISVGDVSLNGVELLRRERSPSLLGAALLNHFVVTLDHSSGSAYFEQYKVGPFHRSSFGFGLAFEPNIHVSLVWDDSPAAQAGLTPGQLITELNGMPTRSTCPEIRRALTAMQAEQIKLTWPGGGVKVTR